MQSPQSTTELQGDLLVLPSLKDFPYEERLRKLKLPSLVYRRKRGKITQTYKYIHGKRDSDCKKIFERTHEVRT